MESEETPVRQVDDPKRVADAKRAAAGPMGEQMAKFPLLFAKPILFGERPSRHSSAKINTATITLANLGRGVLAVTCHHVIERYREQRKSLDKPVFLVGNVELDPLAQLVDENARLDLASIRLTDDQVRAMMSDGEIGSCVFQPKSWPSPPLKEGEYIAFGGFPGSLRTLMSFDELELSSWSSGGSPVSSVSERHFVAAFEREYWVSSFGVQHQMGLRDLGGMSGGPALIHRGLYWDLVGIVSEYHESYDAMFFASLRHVGADGTIERVPV